MAKNNVGQWDATAANNTDVGGINIAEGCPPSNVNDAMREMMAQLKTDHVHTLPAPAIGDDTTDFNTLTDPGHQPAIYRGSNLNGPGEADYFHVENYVLSGGQITQIARSYATPGNAILMRGKYQGVWSGWVRFTTTRNKAVVKAWAIFSATGTIARSFNITSVTKNSTGRWSVVIDYDMDSANYLVIGSAVRSNSATFLADPGSFTATGFNCSVVNNSDTYTDPSYIMFAVFGDLTS